VTTVCHWRFDRPDLQDIARTNEGDRAQHGARGAIAARQYQYLLFGVGRDAGDHLGMQLCQQRPAFTQRRHRIVIAAQYHQPGAGPVQGNDELVVLLACIAGRGTGIEDVAGRMMMASI